MITKLAPSLLLIVAILMTSCATVQRETVEMKTVFALDDKGFPVKESIDNLFDEMDYQRATIAYLWAMPQMTFQGQYNLGKHYGVKDQMDFLIQYDDPSVVGMLTPNTVVKYVVNVPDLTKTGPLLLEMPGGQLVGLMMDFQMHWVADLGLVSKAGPKPEKILFLGPDDEVPAGSEGLRIERVHTNQAVLAIRVLQPKVDKDLEKQIKLYPWSERSNPAPNRLVYVDKDADTYFIRAPKGMDYWRQLNDIVQKERVLETDRYMMSHLAAVGIEKGKPFNPSARQKKILERAAFIGEKMAMVCSFVPRDQQANYRDDTRWVHPLTLNHDHRTEFTQQFEARVDWTWEAYGLSPAMKAKYPGKGSTYLASYRDDDGQWLDGGKDYKFKLAAKVPAKQFWEFTVYNLDTRGIIVNGTDKTAINSFTEGLVTNPDGTIDMYFGPQAPAGKETNWVKTNPDEYWFAYFRLYAPTETYFDRSWPMYDIEEIK